MDLKTTYLGLDLKNPIVSGASPLATSLDSARELEDAGVSAIVMSSLFEEEILGEVATQQAIESYGESFAEAMSYMVEPHGFHVGPDRYLESVRQLKDALGIPVIGSLNGATPGGWTSYAKKIEQAGADALELNIFFLATDPAISGHDLDERMLEVVRSVTGEVSIPVAVKLSPYISSIPSMARQLVEAGAAGLVLFNRFYQPDIDIEKLEVEPNLRLSTSEELRLRLRWLAVLSGQIDASLSATGGAHTAVDVIKAVMAGAHTVQMVSALLIHGPAHVARTLEAFEFWMKEHDYTSVAQMVGSMNLSRTPNPAAIARANYMQVLDSWQR
jgi:dihydroorotate dehydrogenase (fumarate)